MRSTATAAGVAMVGLVLSVAGCAGNDKAASPTTRPASAAERGDRALKDPFKYSPDWSDTDVGGGGTADFDRKGFQKDLGHVLMP